MKGATTVSYAGRLIGLAMLAWGSNVAAVENQCGVGEPCKVSDGSYHLGYPEGWDGVQPLPAVVFFHGHGSSGENILKRKSLRSQVAKAGYLLIAPNGIGWQGHPANGWPARTNAPTRLDDTARDDMAFTTRVLDDVAQRVPLARDRVLVSGYSSGGSLAWQIACHGEERFAGHMSIAGGLRRPNPETRCPRGPARLLHFHGFKDSQVPIEGRAITAKLEDGSVLETWHQGDVFEALGLLRDTNECRSNPNRIETDAGLQCRIWDSCASGRDIQFCLHDGGHGFPAGWLSKTLGWFETQP